MALVLVHAVPGVVGLLAGLWAMAPPRPADGRRGWRRGYALCIAVMIAGLGALLVHDWSGLAFAARVAFAGLVLLASVMAYRLWRAHREASRQRAGWQMRYVDHVYFTYVALWIGFLVLPALDLPHPQVVVPLLVIAVLVTGHVLVARYKRRLTARGTGEGPAEQSPEQA